MSIHQCPVLRANNTYALLSFPTTEWQRWMLCEIPKPRWQGDVVPLPSDGYQAKVLTTLLLFCPGCGQDFRADTLFRSEDNTEMNQALEDATSARLRERQERLQQFETEHRLPELRRYSFLTGYALRTEQEEEEMVRLRQLLHAAGIYPGWEEVAREVPRVKKAAKKPQVKKRK